MKILWAVDIFENNPKAINASMRFLKALNWKIDIKVDAVSSIFPINPEVVAKEGSKEKEKYSKRLNLILGKALRQDWFGKSILLFETQIPQRVAVMNITELAKKSDYDAILLVKHSYKNRKPHYLGSFAEMTAFLSSVPIFLINPDGFIPTKLDNIFIALDESSKKEKEFKELIRFLPPKESNIKLFHRMPVPFYYLSKESIKKYVADQKRVILKSLESIKRIGEHADIHIEFDVKESSKNIGDSILKQAKKGESDLLAIVHKGKEAPGYFFGRITRRVLQRADRPVLLFRP